MILRIAIGFICIEAIVFALSVMVAFTTSDPRRNDNMPWWGAAAVLNGVAVFVGLLWVIIVGIEFAFTGVVNW